MSVTVAAVAVWGAFCLGVIGGMVFMRAVMEADAADRGEAS